MKELYLRRENDHWSFNLFPRVDVLLNPESGRLRKVLRKHDQNEAGIFVRHYLKHIMIYVQDGQVVIQIGRQKYRPTDDLECSISKIGPFFKFVLSQNGSPVYKTWYWDPRIALLAYFDPDFGVYGDQDVFKCIHNTVQGRERDQIVWS